MTETMSGGSADAGNPGAGGDTAAGGGGQGFDWKGALGDQHQTFEPLLQAKGWKSPVEALTGYSELEKLVGSDKVAIPGKDAKPEEWDKVYAKLGRPEKPEGYELKKPEGLGAYSDELAGKFREAAHKAGLTPAQAAALHDWWTGEAGAGEKLAAEKAEAEAKALDGEIAKNWGAEKDAKLEVAKRAAQHFGFEPELLDQLEKKIGSFKLLDGMARMGALLAEDKLSGGGSGGGAPGAGSPEAAKAELGKLSLDQDFQIALTDRGHPGHAEAVRRWTALQAAANPMAVSRMP